MRSQGDEKANDSFITYYHDIVPGQVALKAIITLIWHK